jgi:osmotically-inducible protein OsmY
MHLLMSNQKDRKTFPQSSIAAIAEDRFRTDSHTALRNISCTAEQGVLVLEGRLSTFFQKQLAQEIVANIEGVLQVVNNIEVVGAHRSLSDGKLAFK